MTAIILLVCAALGYGIYRAAVRPILAAFNIV